MAYESRRLWQCLFITLALASCGDDESSAQAKFDRLSDVYAKNQALMCKCVGDCDDDQPGAAARDCYIDIIQREPTVANYFDCWSQIYAADNVCLSDANRCAAEQESGACGMTMNERRRQCVLSDELEEQLDDCEDLADVEE